MTETPTLLQATAANHRAWFRRCALAQGGGIERCDGLEIIFARGHGTLAFPRTRRPEQIAEAMRRARALGLGTMACFSLTEDDALGAELVHHGFEWGWQPWWMAVDLARVPDDPLEHPVGPASGERPYELPYTISDPSPSAVVRLAVHEGGQIVGHVAVNPWRRFAGIYDMGVVPDRRRRGIGRALTLAACRLARDRGCTHALLNATPEGELLYSTVGFEMIGKGRTWWLHPCPPA